MQEGVLWVEFLPRSTPIEICLVVVNWSLLNDDVGFIHTLHGLKTTLWILKKFLAKAA